MERLTEYEIVGGHVHAVPTGDVDQAMMRLAAYEDTGLTPQACAEAREAGKVLSSCDISFRRLAELLTADRDGRLVVLPCKVGDTVYTLRRTFDGADAVGETELWWDDIPILGKTVFLTRKEAEKALEAMKNE